MGEKAREPAWNLRSACGSKRLGGETTYFSSTSSARQVTPRRAFCGEGPGAYALTLAEKRGEVLIEMQRLVGLTRSAARTFVQACCRGSAVGTPSRQGNGGPDRLAQGVGGGAIHPP